MKLCSKCGEEKTVDQFGKNKSSKDGLAFYCRDCKRRYQHDYYRANTDKYQKYNKNWRTQNKHYKAQADAAYAKAHPDRVKKAKAKYREANREKLREAGRAYQASNPELRKSRWQEYRSSNQDKITLKEARRRAQKKGNGIFVILPKELRRLRSQPCIYCGDKSEHMDHVIPVSKGGRHSVGNLVPACAKCNISKSDKFLVEWKASSF